MIPVTDAFADATDCDVCGRDSCEEHLPPDPADAQSASRQPRLRVFRASEIIETPGPNEIVEAIVWSGCLTVLPAESGAGKTFVLLDLAAAVSAEMLWHQRQTMAGSVLYVSYEGDALGRRLRALRDVQGQRLEHLYIIRASDPLSPRVTREGEERSIGERTATEAILTLRDELAATERPPLRVVIVDTVRASLAGNEDSSEHVSAYLRAVRRLMAVVPEAGCVLAHHAGWQDGDTQRKRERGSSAWRGNVDATLYLEAGEYDADTGEAPLTLRTLKVRDGEKPGPLHLIRRRVELPGEIDRHGQPVTSCVIERDRRSRSDRDAERAQAEAEAQRETDLAVLRAMRDYPAATNINRLRPYVGLRMEAVSEAVARILRAAWAQEGKRGHPFTLTAAGMSALNGHHL